MSELLWNALKITKRRGLSVEDDKTIRSDEILYLKIVTVVYLRTAFIDEVQNYPKEKQEK